MKINLTGKHALVCGASKGIGRAIALQLAESGAQVTIVSRNVDALSAVLSKLDDKGGQQHSLLVADFFEPEELEKKMRSLVTDRPVDIFCKQYGWACSRAIIGSKSG